MEQNSSRRCVHFQIHSESLNLDGPPAYLAVRRCLMTERMIVQLRATDEGAQLADKLVVNGTNGKQFAFVGPDLEAVTQRSCTFRRCDERCTPAYKHHLSLFGIADPNITVVGCDDEDDGSHRRPEDAEPHASPCN
jgi:hypothetical protein